MKNMNIVRWLGLLLLSFAAASTPKGTLKREFTSSSPYFVTDGEVNEINHSNYKNDTGAIFQPKFSFNGIFCGWKLTHRIVGGKAVAPDVWPWFVRLRNWRREFYCGGTFITHRHILTAAHCLLSYRSKFSLPYLKVSPPPVDHFKGPRDQLFGVSKIIRHPKYGRGGIFHNDIAILVLEKPFNYSIPICLNSIVDLQELNIEKFQAPLKTSIENGGRIRENVNFSIIGYGRLTEYNPPSKFLQEAKVNLIKPLKCEDAYKELFNAEKMICAGREEGGVDSCQGDSGGPLMFKDENSRWNQVGIISFGFRCGSPHFPGVYTRISNYINWIKTVVKSN